MSGGHFEYLQYRISDIAEEIQRLIDSNEDSTMNEWGETNGRFYSATVIGRFREAVLALRRAQIMAHRVDWLVSGDDGEDSFLSRWDEELRQALLEGQ
jgi:hypothetical protein